MDSLFRLPQMGRCIASTQGTEGWSSGIVKTSSQGAVNATAQARGGEEAAKRRLGGSPSLILYIRYAEALFYVCKLLGRNNSFYFFLLPKGSFNFSQKVFTHTIS
ncbi:hypothetical protein POVWA1_006780 [Plasmodium ovale wallikeri]|uniref:Uncharacterized protein n=1 Tax=Plasmodium ovale wallikeri TaxID=864142 RepID=A0A1A8YIJ5_PLAOA|nr:hypothetical protein POVWA1_006780 [Plasmodium ovale wallikeri]